MKGATFRFTAQSFSKDGSGAFRLRKETVFQQESSQKPGYCFHTASCREFIPGEEQTREDAERIGRVEKELNGQLK